MAIATLGNPNLSNSTYLIKEFRRTAWQLEEEFGTPGESAHGSSKEKRSGTVGLNRPRGSAFNTLFDR